MVSDSGKFYILVDNRPWLKDLVSRPTHLWQLMVTKVAETSLVNHIFVAMTCGHWFG